jgi:hypothetical protein
MIRPDLPRLALTVRQPWLWAMENLGKDIENRSWPTQVRGTICLHAGLGMKQAEFSDAMEDIFQILGADDRCVKSRLEMKADAHREYEATKGRIIATVDIVDCVTESTSPWFFGRYGFVLANFRRVEPIAVRGKLGFFDWRSRVMGVAA